MLSKKNLLTLRPNKKDGVVPVPRPTLFKWCESKLFFDHPEAIQGCQKGQFVVLKPSFDANGHHTCCDQGQDIW